MLNERTLRSLDFTLIWVSVSIIVFSLLSIGSVSTDYEWCLRLGLDVDRLHNAGILQRLLWMKKEYVVKQALWVSIGILLAAVFICFPHEDLRRHTRKLYLFNLLLLVSVLFVGREIMGAQRWISLGPFGLQPSEFAKVIIIICLADFLAVREGRLNRLRDLLPCFAYVGLPMLMVLKQPDLGTSLVFIAILFGMLFTAGARPSLLVVLIGVGVLTVAVLFVGHSYLHQRYQPLEDRLEERLQVLEFKISEAGGLERTKLLEERERLREELEKNPHQRFHKYILKEYQMARLTSFLNPEADLLGSGYHVWQSRIAVGSSGFWGKGLLRGTQSFYEFLPIRHTDFIFSAVAEEFGFLGAVVLLGLYFTLLYRGLCIAREARDTYGTLLAVGVVSMFAFQVFVNVGMAIGIMPVTGLPLPLFSYGGSSAIASLISLGILLNINIHKKKIIF